jgi:predicted DNA-binding protein
MSTPKDKTKETFLFYYGKTYNQSFPLHLKRITPYIVTEALPKIEALNEFGSRVSKPIQDCQEKLQQDLKQGVLGSLSEIGRLNKAILSADEFAEQLTLLVDFLQLVVDITSSTPKEIKEALEKPLKESSDFWMNQDLEELRRCEANFRSHAKMARKQH